MGEMGHTGEGGYLDVHSLLPDGTNYLAHTVHVVADLIEGYTPTR